MTDTPLTEMPTWCRRAQNVEATTLNVRFRESRKTALGRKLPVGPASNWPEAQRRLRTEQTLHLNAPIQADVNRLFLSKFLKR